MTRVVYTIYGNMVRFIDADFIHDHEISTMTIPGAHVMRSEMRAQIHYLTEFGCNADEIRLHLGLSVFPQVMYNIRHHQLRQYRICQTVQLEKKIPKYSNFDTCLLRDQKYFDGYCFFILSFQELQSVKRLL
jgi:hypothetical protein